MVIEKEKDSITVRLDEGKHFLLVEERFVLLCVPHSTFISPVVLVALSVLKGCYRKRKH